MMYDNTLVIFKPHLSYESILKIILIFYKNEFKISKLHEKNMPNQFWNELYISHSNKPFFQELVEDFYNKKVFIAEITGKNIISRCRTLIGATDPSNAEYGTIRRLFGVSKQFNAVHSSDSLEAYQREIDLFNNYI